MEIRIYANAKNSRFESSVDTLCNLKILIRNRKIRATVSFASVCKLGIACEEQRS